MSQVPSIPENAPFNPAQRQWLNGWLAGALASTYATGTDDQVSEGQPSLLILYGSQTGTAEGLAKLTARSAQSMRFAPRVFSMDKYESADLSATRKILIITSTYGDGDPPDNAQRFWQWLNSDAVPRMEETEYSVLALGDTNYPQFCEFGKKCDSRFEELGATRVHPRVDCDVDYEAPASGWMTAALAALRPDGSNLDAELEQAPHASADLASRWSRNNPFAARLKTNRRLTRDGSGKDVRHFEIDLGGSHLTYEVGDALGVFPSNCLSLIDQLLSLMGCDGEEAVTTPAGSEIPFRLALQQHYDLGRPSSELLKAIANRCSDSELNALISPERGNDLRTWLWGRDILDLISLAPRAFQPKELTPLLKRLQPRLYSISSSSKAHPGEVHLTVGVVQYQSHGRRRMGVCSTFLAERCGEGVPVPLWIQASHGFRLPTDAARDIIMVGPGTGIAPFHAFLEERRAVGASGRNWLFFGDQRRAYDYLYEAALEGWKNDGHLARLDLAFSRDQAEKLYVQHRILEAADEVWTWLENGAHFYVCGDASRMAKDVDAALRQVVERCGRLATDEAAAYVENLKSEKRYQRDVY